MILPQAGSPSMFRPMIGTCEDYSVDHSSVVTYWMSSLNESDHALMR